MMNRVSLREALALLCSASQCAYIVGMDAETGARVEITRSGLGFNVTVDLDGGKHIECYCCEENHLLEWWKTFVAKTWR